MLGAAGRRRSMCKPRLPCESVGYLFVHRSRRPTRELDEFEGLEANGVEESVLDDRAQGLARDVHQLIQGRISLFGAGCAAW
jgi:hypothetical protein